jgi:hypothetical protein
VRLAETNLGVHAVGRHVDEVAIRQVALLERGVIVAPLLGESGHGARIFEENRFRSPVVSSMRHLRHAGISFWLASGVDPAECARRAGQSIQVLFRYCAKFLADARNHANT